MLFINIFQFRSIYKIIGVQTKHFKNVVRNYSMFSNKSIDTISNNVIYKKFLYKKIQRNKIKTRININFYTNIKNQSVGFSTTSKHEASKKKLNEELILVQIPNPLNWLLMKWRFIKLRYFWDAEFNEAEFLTGAKQAVVTITHLISEKNFDGLKGLLTQSALDQLKHQAKAKWPEISKQNIAVRHSDIKGITPFNIRMMMNMKNGHRFCDIDTLCIALKNDVTDGVRIRNKFFIYKVVSRFYCDYSVGSTPNWTVAVFHITVSPYVIRDSSRV